MRRPANVFRRLIIAASVAGIVCGAICLAAEDASSTGAPQAPVSRAPVSRAVVSRPGFGPIASVEASSEDGPAWSADQIADWDWLSSWRADDEREGAWVQLNFAGPQRVGAVQLVDRANEKGEVAAIRLSFSDGSGIDYLLPPHPEYPGLAQPGVIYTPVDEHILAGYAKKTSSIVHAWDAHAYPLEYHRTKGSFFIRFEPRMTTHLRVTVTKMVQRERRPANEPFRAQLAFVRPVIMPDDTQPLASEVDILHAGRKGFGLTQGVAEAPWTLENDSLRLEVSQQTGLPVRFTSRLPEPVDLCTDAAGKPAASLYVQCIDREWLSRFDTLLSWRRSDGIEKGLPYQELVCIVVPSEKAVATATIRYRMFPDRLEQKLQFDYLVDDWARYRIGMAMRSDPKEWPEHRDTGGWDSTSHGYLKAYSHAYDVCWEQGDWRCLMWPLDVLRRKDRFLLWGSLDLKGPHFVMAPHVPEPENYPSIYYMPLLLTRGDSYTLDLCWKSFLRDEDNGYPEVLNWYSRRTHFEFPELAGIPVRLTQDRSRTLTGGGRVAPSVRPSYPIDTPGHLDTVEQALVKAGVRHVVYGGWDAWVNPPESISAGTQWGADVGKLSTEKMQQDVRASRANGLRSYLYLNHFCKPPWRGGQLMSADDPRDREWFLERFKSFYITGDFDGVFWDCGWHPISWSSPNIWISSNPRGDELQGWLKIFARIYAWMKENDPNDSVISGNAAAPTTFFDDCVHTEGGGIASPMLTEDAKAFMKPVVAYWIPPYHDLGVVVLEKRGIKQKDLMETGMPADMTDEIWANWMRLGLKAVGLGRSLATQGEVLVEPENVKRRDVFPPWRGWAFFMPQTQQTPELDAFGSRITGVPVLWQTRAVKADRPDVFGTAWVCDEEMLVSLYRDAIKPADKPDAAAAPVPVRIRIDGELIREHGFTPPVAPPTVHVLSTLGICQPNRGLSHRVEQDAVVFEGELAPGELALIRWPGRDR